ncbi:MAG TPA: hemolysin family protein [Bryobacteraceae bacterium]|jgi:CBS domain containing-hemolysin-like protein
MTLVILLIVSAAVMSALMVLSTLVQAMYQESMRLRMRAVPAVDFFKDTLEDKLGQAPEYGFLAFSLIKHIVLVLFALVVLLLFNMTGAGYWESAAEAAAVAVAMLILTCHMIPNILFRKTECRWLLPFVPGLRFLILLMRPLSGLLAFVLSLSELSTANPVKEEPPTSSEQIEALIDASAEEGIIEEDDRKLLQSAASFGDKTVREVMTPRPNIVAIQQDKSLEELRQLVVKEQYSRILVFEKNIDEVSGFVHARDMFEIDDQEERERRTVKELMRPLRPVPETKLAHDLMREIQKEGSHIAVVVDEYGNTAGLVTMEDLVEQIVGEIQDEHDPERDFDKQSDGSYILAGNFDVDRLEELVEFKPDEELESTTVGGLVTEWLGHVPERGETAERDGIRIEVLASSDRRVEQVKVQKLEQPTVT